MCCLRQMWSRPQEMLCASSKSCSVLHPEEGKGSFIHFFLQLIWSVDQFTFSSFQIWHSYLPDVPPPARKDLWLQDSLHHCPPSLLAATQGSEADVLCGEFSDTHVCGTFPSVASLISHCFCFVFVDQSGSSHQTGSDTLSLSHSALLQRRGYQPHTQHERVSA